MNIRMSVIASLLMTALLMFASPAQAQTNGGAPQGDRPQLNAIRQARLAACSYKSVGTTCTFSRDGQRTGGTCQPAGDGQLACFNVVGRPGFYGHSPSAGGMSAGDLPEQ
jgi:hypothetical protein